MSDSTAGEGGTGEPGALLPWPPPGLARIQGDLSLVVRKLALAGGVFALPLLAVLTVPEGRPGLGPLGEAWWVALVTSLVGVVLLADAVVALVRLVLRARTALTEGYPLRVVGLVAADRDRDHGYLLQGARAYSAVPQEVRTVIGRARLLGAVFFLCAAGWLAFGFGVLVVAAARGLLSPRGLVAWTLAPAVMFGGAGLVLRAVEGSLSRRARREWHRHPWAQDLVRQDVESWTGAAQAYGVGRAGGRPRRLVLAVAGIVAVACLSAIPPATLVPVSSTGAVLAGLASATFGSTQARAAEAEAYRSWRIDPDPSLTPEAAGELFNVVTWVGAQRDPVPGHRLPARDYPEDWFPRDPPASMEVQIPPLWTDTVWVRADTGLSAEEVDYLRAIAAHPAHEEFSRLAAAGALDFAGGVYDTGLLRGMTMYEVPIPRMHALRLGAQAHAAAAALHSYEGRHDEAERMSREIISVGFLLLDDSPVLIGSLVGAVMAETGGHALRQALRRAGRTEALAGLEAAVGGAYRAARVAGYEGRRDRLSGDEFLRRAQAIAADSTAVRGLRWEFAHTTAIATPCRSMHTIVFGAGPEYDRWLEEVRASLVRYDAERDLFSLVERGLVREGASSSFLARALTAAMGGGDATASCARFIATLEDMS